MRSLMSLCLALLAPLALGAQQPYAGAVNIGTVDSLQSAVLKESRRYLVYTPPSYRDTTWLPRAYPVVYLLDGDAHFHSFTGLLQALGTGVNGTFVVPEMIVVAIPNTDRQRDMSPTHVDVGPDGKPNPGLKTTGGMPNFLQFIRTELIPRIESSYRTAPYRMFVGHSLGGITAIDALYTMPETFTAYLAIDPSLWWDDRILLKRAKEYFSKPGLAGKALFVGQANTINPDDSLANVHFGSIIQFNSILGAYTQSGIRYAYKYYPADSHGSVPLIAEYEALRFFFDGYALDMAKASARPQYVAEHFDQVSKMLGYRALPSERTLEQLGRASLQSDTAKAIAFFQMHADLYPTSARAWDALGEGWQAKGDVRKAADYYRRALKLSPGNQHAQDMLKKLGSGNQ